MRSQSSFYFESWGHIFLEWDSTLHQILSLHFSSSKLPNTVCEHFLEKEVHRVLARYFNGEKEDFASLSSYLPQLGKTDFERKIYKELALIPYGEIISYGELAKRAGSPKACQAVGNVLRKNPILFFYPCHRIVKNSYLKGEDDHPGGFTALGGMERKKRLLDLEIHL